MGDVFFVLRALLITSVLVFFMQIRIGSSTIEQHSLAWLQNSVMVDNLRAVANGTIKAVGQGYHYLANAMGGESAKEKQGDGDSSFLGFKVRRSEAYHRQKERERKAAGARSGSDSSSVDEDAID